MMVMDAKLLLFSCLLMFSGVGVTKGRVFKTIKTEHGDVYDCVDINKQPSLQHPALKDHKVHLRPPQEILQLTERLRKEKYREGAVGTLRMKFSLKQSCPSGSVPIRRPTSQNFTVPSTTYIRPLDDTSRAGVQFAGLIANGRLFRGAHAFLGLHNPKVGSDQSSSSIVAMISNDGSTFNRIEAGWTVNPSEYGDTKTRLYVYWTRDGYRSTGCFNTKCPGFILASTSYPPGYVFEEISKWREVEYYTEVFIMQAQTNWWLLVEGEIVGYWPNEILTTLSSGARTVKFGGEVFQPDPSQSSPKMGSGSYQAGLALTTAIDKGIEVVNSDSIPVFPDPSFASVKMCNCFFAGANYDRGGRDGYAFLYGGGGGKDCNRCDISPP